MMIMAGGTRKRSNLVDVLILLGVLIVVAVVVLIVTLNWGTWDPDREHWDGETPSQQKDQPATPTDETR